MGNKLRLTIQNRFLILVGLIGISGITIIILFYSTISEIHNNNIAKANVDELVVEYQKIQQIVQDFQIAYAEDQGFLKSGNSRYIRNFDASQNKLESLIQAINQSGLPSELDLSENMERLVAANFSYAKATKELANQLYLKGSKSTGKIGELLKNAENCLQLSPNQNFAEQIGKLNKLLADYMLNKEPDYNDKFTATFNQLSFLVSGNVVSPNLNLVNDSTLIPAESGKNQKFIEEINQYKSNFIALVKIDQKIGFNSNEGLQKEIKDEAAKFDPELRVITNAIAEKSKNLSTTNFWLILIVVAALMLSTLLYGIAFSRYLIGELRKLNKYLLPLSKGNLPGTYMDLGQSNELQQMTKSINELIQGLKKTTSFAEKIGRGIFTTEFEPLSSQDALGNSLIEMRKNLIKAQEEEKNRQHQDNLRKWANEGLAEFNEILRQSAGDIDALTSSIVRNMTKFLKANQAGLFLINDTKKDDIHLELVATYAYDQERKKQKKIYIGEGLVGMCAVEKATVYLEDIPQGYLSITSGLGGASPKCLLIVPLKLENEIFGAIEIASFNKLKSHEIEFVERVTESISSTLSLAKINTRTSMLLEKSQRQAEEMAAQEEEMRQNYEELQATQEESARREAEMSSILQAINSSSLVVEFDLNGYIISANQAILDLLKIESSDLIGKHQSDFEKMDEQNIRPEEFWERLRRGEIITESHRIMVEDRTYWLHEVYTPILDANGKAYKILNLATDITESKKLEQELLEKAEQMVLQEEELRRNLIELEATQAEMDRKQQELSSANAKIKENESFLQESIEASKEHERRLKARNAELVEREVVFQKQLQETEYSMKVLKIQLEECEKAKSKLESSEGTLKKFVKEAKDQHKNLESKLIVMQEREQQLISQIDELNVEIKKLKNNS
jgi:PAS domain S-box-containing protein